MIFANGYPRPYQNDAAEVASASAKPATWYPSSIDFQATATNSGDPAGAGTLADMLKIVAGKPAGSISLLGLVGHAAGGTGGTPRTFGFSGQVTVNPANVILTAPGFLTAATLTSSMGAITPLRNRFAADARIVLYACNTGTDNTLLDPISNAFGVCVDGFSDEVSWCFTWTTPGNRINPSSRGRVFYDTKGLLALGMIPCAGFSTDATTLKPDLTSCTGVKSSSKPAGTP
ncbi:MAG: hypothetical protein ACLPX8_06860 [Bryobacteraceae bacterium]|jgi:hypothetical protein